MPHFVIFIMMIFKENWIISLNVTETMMRFVSVMDKNVRVYKGERTFLREEARIIMLWKGFKGYLEMKIGVKTSVKKSSKGPIARYEVS